MSRLHNLWAAFSLLDLLRLYSQFRSTDEDIRNYCQL